MVNRHRPQQTQQRREQQDRQEGVFHKSELIGLEGEDCAENAVNRIHSAASSPLKPKTDVNSGEQKTDSAEPWASTDLSSRTT